MVRINIGEKQKILVGSIVIVLCLIALGFMYQNNIKAYYMGIDVRYLNDPLYCEKGDDCGRTNECKVVNKYYLPEKRNLSKCSIEFYSTCNEKTNTCFLTRGEAADE
ncbi:MAG: hypothetical protein H6500_00640 [Candidatus Woesearchaeota archaeon]|nr:MAG: hypothetical protein H6500_00640 [Candidatus Woesearchaeota archaeon]